MRRSKVRHIDAAASATSPPPLSPSSSITQSLKLKRISRRSAILTTLAVILVASLFTGALAEDRTVDPCKRQPFRGRCPTKNDQQIRSQFVLRYYVRGGECVSYPYGHCANDDNEPKLYRYKEECEDACLHRVEEVTEEEEAAAAKTTERNDVAGFLDVGSASQTVDIHRAEATYGTNAPLSTHDATPTTPNYETPKSECQRQRDAGSSLIKGGFVPECDVNGDFTPLQCEPNGIACFCVNPADGIEVKNSRTTQADQQRPDCAKINAATPMRTNECTGGAEAGPCRAVMQRWYYDEASAECRQFVYGGCGGNGNNYANEAACRRRCATAATTDAHCAGGAQPLRTTSGSASLVNCAKTECPVGYKCNVLPTGSICCPDVEKSPNAGVLHSGIEPSSASTPIASESTFGGVPSVCTQPKERGPCDRFELRYFYNAELKECKYFFYGGCDGNANNFKQIDECERTCMVQQFTTTSPPITTPLIVSEMMAETSPTESASTTSTFVEQIQSTSGAALSTVPEAEDAQQGSSTTAAESDVSSSTTAGEALTMTSDDTVPPSTAILSGDEAVSSASTDAEPSSPTQQFVPEPTLPPIVPQAILTSTTRTRPTPSTTTPKPLPSNICLHPKDDGNCGGQFVRWFWNQAGKNCETFTYTGCGGNGNNFGSREECIGKCHKQVVPPKKEISVDLIHVCDADIDVGNCEGIFLRYAFDRHTGECRQFQYGGCGGNGNNFASMSDCRRKCLKKDSASLSANICTHTIDSGDCTGRFTRYAYDSASNECRQFNYGGCGGNGNNFATIAECRSACIKVECGPVPECDTRRCQLVNNALGCPFCSCPPVSQFARGRGGAVGPLPTAAANCPPFDVNACTEPCIIFSNRRGCQECVCPVMPAAATDDAVLGASRPLPPSSFQRTSQQKQSPPPTDEVSVPDLPPQPPSGSVHLPPRGGFQSLRRPVVAEEPHQQTTPLPQPPVVDFNSNQVDESPAVAHLPQQPQPTMFGDLGEKCTQPVDPGPCRNFVQRWHFNPSRGECEPFQFGGCAGNRNHFFTQNECVVHCARFLRKKQEEESSTAASPPQPLLVGSPQQSAFVPPPVEQPVPSNVAPTVLPPPRQPDTLAVESVQPFSVDGNVLVVPLTTQPPLVQPFVGQTLPPPPIFHPRPVISIPQPQPEPVVVPESVPPHQPRPAILPQTSPSAQQTVFVAQPPVVPPPEPSTKPFVEPFHPLLPAATKVEQPLPSQPTLPPPLQLNLSQVDGSVALITKMENSVDMNVQLRSDIRGPHTATHGPFTPILITDLPQQLITQPPPPQPPLLPKRLAASHTVGEGPQQQPPSPRLNIQSLPAHLIVEQPFTLEPIKWTTVELTSAEQQWATSTHTVASAQTPPAPAQPIAPLVQRPPPPQYQQQPQVSPLQQQQQAQPLLPPPPQQQHQQQPQVSPQQQQAQPLLPPTLPQQQHQQQPQVSPQQQQQAQPLLPPPLQQHQQQQAQSLLPPPQQHQQQQQQQAQPLLPPPLQQQHQQQPQVSPQQQQAQPLLPPPPQQQHQQQPQVSPQQQQAQPLLPPTLPQQQHQQQPQVSPQQQQQAQPLLPPPSQQHQQQQQAQPLLPPLPHQQQQQQIQPLLPPLPQQQHQQQPQVSPQQQQTQPLLPPTLPQQQHQQQPQVSPQQQAQPLLPPPLGEQQTAQQFIPSQPQTPPLPLLEPPTFHQNTFVARQQQFGAELPVHQPSLPRLVEPQQPVEIAPVQPAQPVFVHQKPRELLPQPIQHPQTVVLQQPSQPIEPQQPATPIQLSIEQITQHRQPSTEEKITTVIASSTTANSTIDLNSSLPPISLPVPPRKPPPEQPARQLRPLPTLPSLPPLPAPTLAPAPPPKPATTNSNDVDMPTPPPEPVRAFARPIAPESPRPPSPTPPPQLPHTHVEIMGILYPPGATRAPPSIAVPGKSGKSYNEDEVENFVMEPLQPVSPPVQSKDSYEVHGASVVANEVQVAEVRPLEVNATVDAKAYASSGHNKPLQRIRIQPIELSSTTTTTATTTTGSTTTLSTSTTTTSTPSSTASEFFASTTVDSSLQPSTTTSSATTSTTVAASVTEDGVTRRILSISSNIMDGMDGLTESISKNANFSTPLVSDNKLEPIPEIAKLEHSAEEEEKLDQGIERAMHREQIVVGVVSSSSSTTTTATTKGGSVVQGSELTSSSIPSIAITRGAPSSTVTWPTLATQPSRTLPQLNVATTSATLVVGGMEIDDTCLQPPDAGPCTDYVPRWYFNAQRVRCEQFSFGSCAGNANNFVTRSQCEARCQTEVDQLNAQLPIRCTRARDEGHGGGYFPKWYYNPRNMRCEQFVFAGSGGNDNQFTNLEDCERSCKFYNQNNGGNNDEGDDGSSMVMDGDLSMTTILQTLPPPAPTTFHPPPFSPKVNQQHLAKQEELAVPALPKLHKPTSSNAIEAKGIKTIEGDVGSPVQPIDEMSEPVERKASYGAEKLPAQPPANVKPLPIVGPSMPAHIDYQQNKRIAQVVQEGIQLHVPQQFENKLAGSAIGAGLVPPAFAGDNKQAIDHFDGKAPSMGVENGAESADGSAVTPRVPICPNGLNAMLMANGNPIMCLPGLNQCPSKSVCYFNGLDFFCCPNEDDPYDQHIFGGYDGEEVKHGYKNAPSSLNIMSIRRRLRRQAADGQSRTFSARSVLPETSFSIDHVTSPLRFDGKPPQRIQSAGPLTSDFRHRRVSPCLEEVDRGHCNHQQLRYFYDINSDTCRLFYYGGCGGNANNFVTQAECDRRCKIGVILTSAAHSGGFASQPQLQERVPAQQQLQLASPAPPNGQCANGQAPLGDPSPVLCGNRTDSIGCPIGYYCRAGPPDVCCPLVIGSDQTDGFDLQRILSERRGDIRRKPFVAPAGHFHASAEGADTVHFHHVDHPDASADHISHNVQQGVVTAADQKPKYDPSEPDISALSSSSSTSSSGGSAPSVLGVPATMCPDGSDALLDGASGAALECGTGFDGHALCPRGYYCSIDPERNGRLCCPLAIQGSNLPAPGAIAPYFGQRAANPGEVIERGSLPSDPKPRRLVTPSPKAGHVETASTDYADEMNDATSHRQHEHSTAPSIASATHSSSSSASNIAANADAVAVQEVAPAIMPGGAANEKPEYDHMLLKPTGVAAKIAKNAQEARMAHHSAVSRFESGNAALNVEEDPFEAVANDKDAAAFMDKSLCFLRPNEGRECREDEPTPLSNLQFFYSAVDRRCKVFFHRGCGGNANRFASKAECERGCA